MLSTSILSRPSGPKELLTIFAIDCAAMTMADVRSFAGKCSEKIDHFGPEYPARKLCRHPGKPLLVDRVGRDQTFFGMQKEGGQRDQFRLRSGGRCARLRLQQRQAQNPTVPRRSIQVSDVCLQLAHQLYPVILRPRSRPPNAWTSDRPYNTLSTSPYLSLQ